MKKNPQELRFTAHISGNLDLHPHKESPAPRRMEYDNKERECSCALIGFTDNKSLWANGPIYHARNSSCYIAPARRGYMVTFYLSQDMLLRMLVACSCVNEAQAFLEAEFKFGFKVQPERWAKTLKTSAFFFSQRLLRW